MKAIIKSSIKKEEFAGNLISIIKQSYKLVTRIFSLHGNVLHIISLPNGLELLTVYAISKIIV